MARSCSSVGFLALLVLLGLHGCSAENAEADPCSVDPSAVYDGSAFEANAAAELALRSRFAAFVQPMKDAELSVTSVPSAQALRDLFGASDPSLRSLTSTYYQGRVERWVDAFSQAAGKNWTPVEPPSGAGGIFGKYIFDARGTDLRQAIEKGMFAATHYSRASSLIEGKVDAGVVDKVLALYGSNPTFPGNDKTGDGGVPTPDMWTAQYAKRRDARDIKNPGLYLKIKSSLTRAQVLSKKGASCDAALQTSLTSVQQDWERTLFATVIFYLNDVTKKMSTTNPTADEQAAGLHGYGEAIGFIHGWKGVASKARIITDAQVDALLNDLGSPADGESSAYQLVTSAATWLPKLNVAIQSVATIYGFSKAEVEGFKTAY